MSATVGASRVRFKPWLPAPTRSAPRTRSRRRLGRADRPGRRRGGTEWSTRGRTSRRGSPRIAKRVSSVSRRTRRPDRRRGPRSGPCAGRRCPLDAPRGRRRAATRADHRRRRPTTAAGRPARPQPNARVAQDDGTTTGSGQLVVVLQDAHRHQWRRRGQSAGQSGWKRNRRRGGTARLAPLGSRRLRGHARGGAGERRGRRRSAARPEIAREMAAWRHARRSS